MTVTVHLWDKTCQDLLTTMKEVGKSVKCMNSMNTQKHAVKTRDLLCRGGVRTSFWWCICGWPGGSWGAASALDIVVLDCVPLTKTTSRPISPNMPF